jgi:hypothetical protein
MRVLSVILVAVLLGSCNQGGGFDVSAGGTFKVLVGTEEFYVRIDNAFIATKARRQMIGAETRQNITGELLRGDGGFNTGYGWHIRPSTIGLTDIHTPECSALPSAVQAEIDKWVDQIKTYCPTGSRFVSEVGR